jgi:peptidyl-prolyl cis-trans isomerase D
MIQFFRRALSSWFALGLFALILGAFIITGVRDPSLGGGGQPGVIATVGSLTITEQEFERAWQRQLDEIRRQNPGVTPEQLARAGAVEGILNDLIAAKAIEAFGAKQGVKAGQPLVDAEIAAVPAFQLGGKFSQSTYEAALASQRLTDRQLRSTLSGDIVRRQLITPIAVAANAPAGLAQPYAQMVLERKEGFIGLVPSATVTGAPQPTDAQLQELYRSRRAALTIPERRGFRFALIDPAQIAARIQPTDAEVAAFYKANAARFGGTEKRQLLQAAATDEAAAKRIAAAGGAGFEAAAAQAGLQRSDLDLGLVARAELASAAGEAAAAAAFALPEGGVSAPVNTQLGWRVYKVTGIQRTPGQTIEQARPAIVAELQKTRGQTQLADTVEKAEAALKKGANLAEVAQQFGLQVVSVPPSTATGQGLPPELAANPAIRPLLDAAFKAEPGEDATVEDLGQNRAALFALGEVVPPSVPPLQSLKPQLADVWVREWQAKRASELAEQIAAEVRQGKPMADAMRSRGLPEPAPANGRRVDAANAPGGQVPLAQQLFLATGAGQVRVAPAPNGQGAYIVQVARVLPPEPAQVAQLTVSAQRQFGEVSAEELARQFALAARTAVGAKINAAAVERLRARLAGEAAPAGQ